MAENYNYELMKEVSEASHHDPTTLSSDIQTSLLKLQSMLHKRSLLLAVLSFC